MEVNGYTLLFSEQALEDIDFFRKSGQVDVQAKISRLLRDVQQHPESGIGKPEKLKHSLSGCMSRRINREHRLLYKIEESTHSVKILSIRYHY